jgi:NAD-dependent SIR2 family protein deacetylase
MTRVISDQLDKQPQEYHRQLVQNLIRKEKLRETIIVSTNYDILIDNALTLHSHEFGLDYGIDFANATDRSYSQPEQSIKLYKLHGSLNWLYCPTCNTILS